MARKTSKAPTRIWKYGARPPVSNRELVRELLRLAGVYYNNLVEIERDRVRRFAAIRLELAPSKASRRLGDRDLTASCPPVPSNGIVAPQRPRHQMKCALRVEVRAPPTASWRLEDRDQRRLGTRRVWAYRRPDDRPPRPNEFRD